MRLGGAVQILIGRMPYRAGARGPGIAAIRSRFLRQQPANRTGARCKALPLLSSDHLPPSWAAAPERRLSQRPATHRGVIESFGM